jgi:hypothetical protein
MLGNPMALYEVVMICNRLNTHIPDWAAEPIKIAIAGYYTGEKSGVIGQSNTPLGRYKETLKHHIRADIYKVAMAWIKDKNKYRNLPTKCIQAWYDGELEFISAGSQGALQVACIGLDGIFAQCSIETLEKHKYFGKNHEIEALDLDEETKSDLRDHQRPPISFGYNDVEVVFKLRPAGQFWGPPCDPPEHIAKLLDPNPAPNIGDE